MDKALSGSYPVPVTGLVISVRLFMPELQWLEHLWDHENMFEAGVVRANEC